MLCLLNRLLNVVVECLQMLQLLKLLKYDHYVISYWFIMILFPWLILLLSSLDSSSNLQDAVQPKGIRDDTTCIVVDIQLPEKSNPPPPPPPKRSGKGVFKCMFRKKTSESSSNIQKDFCEPDVVEELFEEGSASLSDRFCLMLSVSHFSYCNVSDLVLYLLSSHNCRLDAKYPVCNMFKLFICAVCQVEIKPGQGVSIHAGSSNTRSSRPWDGPFLCSSCQEKKEAMEGRRPFGGQLPHSL